MGKIVKLMTKTLLKTNKYYKKELIPLSISSFIDNFITQGFGMLDLVDDVAQKIIHCLEDFKATLPDIPEKLILMIQTRQGGKDAQDLSAQIMQMYVNFFTIYDIDHNIVDISFGTVGIHQATIFINNNFPIIVALLLENGLHRIERYSPFNAQNKKQTSHVQIKSTILYRTPRSIIRNSDLEIIPIKASGPGGQYVNKAQTGIILRHKPTGIMARSTQFRSQQANKKFALEILRAQVEEYEQSIQQKALEKSLLEKLKPPPHTHIRTYDLIDNIIRNQYIKYKIPNAQKVIRGYIVPLLMYNILYAIWRTCNKII